LSSPPPKLWSASPEAPQKKFWPMALILTQCKHNRLGICSGKSQIYKLWFIKKSYPKYVDVDTKMFLFQVWFRICITLKCHVTAIFRNYFSTVQRLFSNINTCIDLKIIEREFSTPFQSVIYYLRIVMYLYDC